MKELLAWLKQPENAAALAAVFVALGTAIRGLGELFLMVGKLKKEDPQDFWDRTGAALCGFSAKLGKFLAWLGIGNKK